MFLTNNSKLAATTIGEIHRDRWQIESIFKSLKQSLRIKTFVGTSAPALSRRSGGVDRDVSAQVPVTAGRPRLVVIEPGCAVEATTVRLPRRVPLAGRTVSAGLAQRARADAAMTTRWTGAYSN